MQNEKEEFKNQYYVLVDESGTLPDPKDKFIVVTGIGVKKLKEANNLISRALKSLRQNIDSQQGFIVNLADFVAGATLTKYNKNNPQFYDLIRESILIEKIINWPELKRKSLDNKKIP